MKGEHVTGVNQQEEGQKGYASITQLYEDFAQKTQGFEQKIQDFVKNNEGCKLFLQALGNNLTLELLFDRDETQLKSLRNMAKEDETLVINDGVLTKNYTLRTDGKWIESYGGKAIEDANCINISCALLRLKPYTSLFHMLVKAGAVNHVPKTILEQITIDQLLLPFNYVLMTELHSKNLLTSMASSHCIKDLPKNVLKLITAEIISANGIIGLLSKGDIEALNNPEISELKKKSVAVLPDITEANEFEVKELGAAGANADDGDS
jgi:hypothetical protein